MPPRKRQKKNCNEFTKTPITNHDIKIEDKDKDKEEPAVYSHYEHPFVDNSIIQDQDEEYEMAIIMDLIKMQEKEDNERQEKEKQEKIERERFLELAIQKRDHNIKEILRKLKILVNTQNSFEKTLISILENTMNTQDLHIKIHDNDIYLQIRSYLGLNNSKGVIRLSDEIKDYANNMFILECKLTS